MEAGENQVGTSCERANAFAWLVSEKISLHYFLPFFLSQTRSTVTHWSVNDIYYQIPHRYWVSESPTGQSIVLLLVVPDKRNVVGNWERLDGCRLWYARVATFDSGVEALTNDNMQRVIYLRATKFILVHFQLIIRRGNCLIKSERNFDQNVVNTTSLYDETSTYCGCTSSKTRTYLQIAQSLYWDRQRAWDRFPITSTTFKDPKSWPLLSPHCTILVQQCIDPGKVCHIRSV